MGLTKQDVRAIRQMVRDEVSVQHTAYHRWLVGARAKIDDGLASLANGERTSPSRVFTDIRAKQARRRERAGR